MGIQAGIVGMGRWGQVLVNAVHAKTDVIDVVAACTGRRANAERYCNGKGIELHDDLDDLLHDTSLDAIILATPHGQHADQIVACAEAGKHVFVEKPFTMDKASAERAAAACAKAGVVCALGHNRRFLPAMARLREIVANREIGDALHVEANISTPGNRHAADHWRSDPAQCPAGSMTGLGVHMTDALISVLGPITQVTATSEIRTHGDISSPVTFMTLRFQSGATGTFSTLFQTASVWFMRVSGNQGWATVRGYHRVATRLNRADEVLQNFDKTDIERAELEAFAAAVSGGAPYPIPPDQAVHGTAVFEAIIASVNSGKPVYL